MRQGLNLPGDLLQDYYAGHDFGEDVVGGGEVEDELHGEEEEGVAEEGLRKGLALPDNLLEDYYALETEVSTDLTVSTEVEFSTELDRHFESSTEEEEEKGEEEEEEKLTSGGKSFTGNPSTTLKPSHNGHWKGEGKAKGKRVRGKAKVGSGEEELLRKEVEDEQVEGAGAVLVLNL